MNRLVCELLSQFGSLRIEALHQRALESRTRTTSSTRFPHRNTLSTRKPDSFLREKRNTVVILVRGFAKCRVKTFQELGISLAFFDQQKGSVTSNKNN